MKPPSFSIDTLQSNKPILSRTYPNSDGQSATHPNTQSNIEQVVVDDSFCDTCWGYTNSVQPHYCPLGLAWFSNSVIEHVQTDLNNLSEELEELEIPKSHLIKCLHKWIKNNTE